MATRNGRAGNILFLMILLAFCIYAFLFIYQTSFLFEGERYHTLFDDAMISMRYARHMAEGQGLQWNPGVDEKVEGFSNPLWVFWMTLFHFLGIAQSKISLFIQASGALFLLLSLIFVKQIAGLLFDRSSFVSNLAVLFTAFYYPLTYWGLMGTEASLQTLIVSAAIWKTLQSMQRGKTSFWAFLLLAIGTLVRLDMMVPALGILGFLFFAKPEKGRAILLRGLPILILFLFVQTLLRFLYYGEFLPNPYFLKMTGAPLLLRFLRGLYFLFDFLWKMNWLLFLLPLVLLFFRRGRGILLLFCVIFVQMLYSIFVGGDAWEEWTGCNRFICFVMPLYMILFCGALDLVRDFFQRVLQLRGDKTQGIARTIFACSSIAIVCFSFLSFNTGSSIDALGEWLLLKRPFYAEDNERMVKRGILLDRITAPKATIGVFWAGAIPYFSRRNAVDFLGRNDKRIARAKINVPNWRSTLFDFPPGHAKRAYGLSIGEMKPDVITAIPIAPEEARPYLKEYVQLQVAEWFHPFLRKGSDAIYWNRIQQHR